MKPQAATHHLLLLQLMQAAHRHTTSNHMSPACPPYTRTRFFSPKLTVPLLSPPTDATRRRTNVLKQLLASMTNLTTTAPSTAASTPRNSLPPTPRGTGSSAAAAAAGSSGAGGAGAKLSGAKGRKPAPAEAAALGQAVYQLLDTFGGGMML